MKIALLSGVLALAIAIVPVAASADGPTDPAMKDAAARARDREAIRQLNLRQLAEVRARDAGYAEGWRGWRAMQVRGDNPSPAGNAEREADYQRKMAEWRRAVALCEGGHHEYCARD